MQIAFSPQVREGALALEVSGSVLTVNGTAVDLASYDAGAAPNDWIVGQPMAVGDEWQVTVLLPIGAGASAAARFPEAVSVEAGAVPVPA
ncbi:hypothetical protein [Paenirhodobacter enshiensis]|uniref:hypothetical protein n=1 Tax=Paenirhodobacter enshiensis TaxID=1105367 RepID=UPI003FA30B86